MIAAAALLSLALVSLGAPPVASTFPDFDPSAERVLFGRAPWQPGGGTPSAVAPIEAVTRGRFVDDNGVLELQEPAPYGESVWLASAGPSGVELGDGVVRARFVVGQRLDSTVLLRATVADDGELLGGYGVSVEKNLLRLYRWEQKIPRFLGAEAKLDPIADARAAAAAAKPGPGAAQLGKLKPGDVVELVVWLVGPHIAVDAFDGATLQPRGHLSAIDRGYARGRVGVRVQRAQDAASGVSLLAVSSSSSSPPAAVRADEGAGAERLVGVARADRSLLADDLQKKIVDDDAERTLLVTDPVGVERVRRSGARVLLHKTQMPWKYVDKELRARLGKPPTRTATGFRIDESYKDDAMVEALLSAYAARFSRIARLVELGRTLEGRPLYALRITKNPDVDEDEPAVLLDGAHHGGELMAIEFVLDAVQQLLERYKQDPEVTRLVDGLDIWCVPLVNVDGNHRFVHDTRDYDRKNARDIDGNGAVDGYDGVDLYRNYPVQWGGLGEIGSRSWPFHYRYRGPTPASEPEIQAMMKLADERRFVASIDYHTNATMVLAPYTDPSMKNPDVNEAWTIAEEITAPLPVQSNGRKYVVARNLYPVDGTAQDYFRFRFGTVALLVEGPTNNPLPFSRGRPAAVSGTRGTWQGLLARVLDGPTVAGRVRDAAGGAVDAEVVIEEMRPQMGEVWTAHKRSGRYQRLLPTPTPGTSTTYTLRFQKPGYKTTTRTIVVTEATGAVRLDVLINELPELRGDTGNAQ